MNSAELVRAASRHISRTEAEFLLEHLLRRSRHELYLDDAPVPARVCRRFSHLVRRCQAGAPVQYLVHSAPFLDFEVYVDHRVLIPRPETEELVLRAASRVQPAIGSRQSAIVVDYGTGSGCIAIALARMFPRVRVLAVDSSSAALTVCRRNAKLLGVSSRLRLVRANSLDHPALCRLRSRVCLLIANPPYLPTSTLPRLESRVRDFEPISALDGGPDGTNIVLMLVRAGPKLLAAGGLLALEIAPAQARRLAKLIPTATIERDLAGRARYFFLPKEA
ncbi:MAG: peptide chain release factor N(5)-glutamine methyltransferase [candidate division WOR-3 bacterium]